MALVRGPHGVRGSTTPRASADSLHPCNLWFMQLPVNPPILPMLAKRVSELPEGYDHKYIYSHVGYNLKATDMQAAIGVAQLERLSGFIEARRRNFTTLRAGLSADPCSAAGV